MTETTTQDDEETLTIGPHLELPEQGGAMYYRDTDPVNVFTVEIRKAGSLRAD